MTVLTKNGIQHRMRDATIEKRLIVTPLLNEDESIGSSSIDVRLGNQFIVMKRQSFPTLDISTITSESVLEFQERVHINYFNHFVLHPGQLVIGSTLEYIQIPPGLMCYVIGKSSWGRMGLIIATATKVDPGFKGCITLELVNHGDVPLILYPGIPIAQLVLHSCDGYESYKGKYDCPIGPQFPKFLSTNKECGFWFKGT